MTELATVARPYARAVFEAALDADALASWSQLLAATGSAVADARVAALIGNPRVPADALVDFLLGLAGRPAAPSPERALLALLAHNGRLALLPTVAAQYEALRTRAENRIDVEVVAAQALTDAQVQPLIAALERRLGRQVRLHQQVDPRLIGGALVRYGDQVIDGSMRGRLERLAAAMRAA